MEKNTVNSNSRKYQYADLPEKGSRVLVGMSGGVDSTVTVMKLLESGCQVTGVTMSTWNNDLPLTANVAGFRHSCYGPDEVIDIEASKKLCKSVGIDHLVVDAKATYHKTVLEYFKSEYRAGRTPNPCVRCNATVKFGALLKGAKDSGIDFDYFCTGHYARLVRPMQNLVPHWNWCRDFSGAGEQFPLLVSYAQDLSKDQTYFLYRIPSAVLEKVRFPLWNLTKKDVFSYAREKKLQAADRSESQDFIPQEYFDIVFSDKPSVEGDFIDFDGHVLGKHRGIEYYTIGQRRGLGVSSEQPLYVCNINVEKNQIVLAHDDDLFANALIAEDWVWPAQSAPREPFDALVKIRLAASPVKARIEPHDIEKSTDGKSAFYKVVFEQPQRAIAPGQSVVAYIDGMIVGGGIISQKCDE